MPLEFAFPSSILYHRSIKIFLAMFCAFSQFNSLAKLSPLQVVLPGPQTRTVSANCRGLN